MCEVVSWILLLFCFIFFFFKQKTAYEMRISDWSSDVCSSDLGWMCDVATAHLLLQVGSASTEALMVAHMPAVSGRAETFHTSDFPSRLFPWPYSMGTRGSFGIVFPLRRSEH